MTRDSSRKKIQTGRELTIILVWKSLAMEFLDLLSLYPWKSGENKAPPLEILQNWCCVLYPLEIPRPKTREFRKFHFFFTWLLEFPYALSSIPLPLEIPWPQPTLFGIFLGRAEVAWKYYFLEINFFFQRVKQSFQEHIKNVFLSTS